MELQTFTKEKCQSVEDYELLEACEKGLDTVGELLTNGANPNTKDSHEQTALHKAVSKNNKEMVELLLEHKADINAIDASGQTVIHIAVKQGNSEMVKLLLSHNAEIKAVDDDLGSVLHIAAAKGYNEIVSLLLQRKASPNSVNKKGQTPLHAAMAEDHSEIVRQLCEHKARLNISDSEGRTVLHFAVDQGNSDMVQLLLDQKASIRAVNNKRESALHIAAAKGHAGIVTLLLQHKANPNFVNKQEQTPLHVATAKGHSEIVMELCSWKAQPNTYDQSGKTAIHYAAEKGNWEIISVLLKHGANPRVKTHHEGSSVIHIAIMESRLNLVEKFLECDIDVDAIDIKGQTAIHKAAAKGHCEIIKLLIKKRAKLKALDKKRQTALHLAALHDHRNVVELLIENKMNLNFTDLEGLSAIHIALMNGNLEIVKALLQHGAEFNWDDEKAKIAMQTPAAYKKIGKLLELKANDHNIRKAVLRIAAIKGDEKIVKLVLADRSDDSIAIDTIHTAAENGHLDIVQLLLNEGQVDPDSKKEDGLTAIECAVEHGHFKIVKKLLDRKADIKNTIHTAAENGHLDIVQLLLEEGQVDPDSKKGNRHKMYVLYTATVEGRYEVVKLLLEKGASLDLLNTKQKETALHAAAMHDQVDIMKLLLDKGADPNIQDKNGCIPIHHAATNGNVKIVKLLKDKSDCTTLGGIPKKTPMMCACVNGHAKVVEILLKLDKVESPVVYKTENDVENVLVEAINRGYEDVAMTIVSSIQVGKALEFKSVSKNRETTPLRMLFEKMPAVAEKAVNTKCTDVPKPATISRDDEKFTVTFHYQYLDDFVDYHADSEKLPDWMLEKFDWTNHCLYILANSDSSKLLKHPAVTTLLYHKWTFPIQCLFIFNFILHILFAVLLTTFALIVLQPESDTCSIASGASNNSTDACDIVSFDGQPYLVVTVGILIILFALIRLGYEIFQMIKFQYRYLLDWVNYVELFLFLGSICFVFVFVTECFCPEQWQWQIGAFCVFLAWIDLMAFFRILPIVGIYVVMFVVIVKNFVKVAALAIILILSFSFSFYMLFYDPAEKMLRTPFQNAGKSFVKTLTMTTGELDFNDIFFNNDGRFLYAGISYPLWILFIVMMPILLNNLLTGLAVGDVNEIQENAKIETLTSWIDFILKCEQLMRKTRYIKIWQKEGSDFESVEDCMTVKINPDEFPKNCVTRKCFWHYALNLSHYDTYEKKLIVPDPSKESKKIEKNFEKLTTRTEELELKFEQFAGKMLQQEKVSKPTSPSGNEKKSDGFPPLTSHKEMIAYLEDLIKMLKNQSETASDDVQEETHEAPLSL